MSNLKIKFLENGKWMDIPSEPVFEVKAGDEREVSARLAKIATDAGKAEIVPEEKAPEKKAETGPVTKDESGPVKKAEAKPAVQRGKGK